MSNLMMERKDLSKLFEQARKLEKFKSFTDDQLKEIIIDYQYPEKLLSGDKFLEVPSVKQKEGDPAEKEFTQHNEEAVAYVANFIESKNGLYETLSTQFKIESLTNDEVDIFIDRILKQYVAETYAFIDDFWKYYSDKEVDFSRFDLNLASVYYQETRSFIGKIIDSFFGGKDDEIAKCDIYPKIPPFPVRESKEIYGSSFDEAKEQHLLWYSNLVLRDSTLSEEFAESLNYTIFEMVDLFEKSITEMIQQLIKKDDPFPKGLWAEIQPEFNSPLLYLSGFIDQIVDLQKILKPLSFLFTYEIKENTELKVKGGHLLPLLAMLYYHLLPEIKKSFEDGNEIIVQEKNLRYSVKGILGHIKEKLLSADLGIFVEKSDEVNKKKLQIERKEMVLKHISLAINLQAYLNTRLKQSISSLIADMGNCYLREVSGIKLSYEISDKGKIKFLGLGEHQKGKSFFGVIKSFFFKGEEDKPLSTPKQNKELDFISRENKLNVTMPSINYELQNEPKIQRQILQHLQTHLDNILKSFEQNFKQGRAISPTRLRNLKHEDKYEYLSETKYYSHGDQTGNLVAISEMKRLQDLLDMIDQTSVALKGFINRQKASHLDIDDTKDIRAELSALYDAFKEITELLGLVSENKEAYQNYASHVKLFFKDYAEMLKPVNERRKMRIKVEKG